MNGTMIWRTVVAWLVGFAAAGAAETQPVYLSSFFREPDGKDGLHLAASRDGYRWREIGPASHTWLRSTLTDGCMRDPCLRQGPDGTFHLVWTTGSHDKGFGYASSRDLVHWSRPSWAPVNEKVAGARNTWAPETFYDAAKQRWLVFWSTTVSDELSKPNADFDHRLYCATTTDFKTFSPTRLFCDPGFNCIDGTMLAAGGKFLLVLKDERRGRKNLHICTAPAPDGPWGPPSKPLPKPGRMVEGPSGLKVGDGYLIYFDVYSDDKYGAVCSRDLRTWQDVTAKVDFPPGIRHATMIEVAPSVLAPLGGMQ